MTLAPHTPQVSSRGPAAAVAALRANGMRVSSARRVVLEALYAARGPATAEELATGVPGQVPQSDLASVYRNLDSLEQIGLVRRLHFGHGARRYVLSDPVVEGFVYCHRCGEFCALPPETLEALCAAVREQTSYEPRLTHFPLAGVCAGCRGEQRGRATHAVATIAATGPG